MIEALAPPRLPDVDYLRFRIDEPWPCQAWPYVLGWLPLGWCMAPPQFEPEDHKWFVVAYNVRGSMEGPSYVIGAADTVTGALLDVGWNLEPWTEDHDCPTQQHRKPRYSS